MVIMSAEDTAESSAPPDSRANGQGKSLNITVFCDLDGPLVDVSRRYYKTYQLAIAETQTHAQGRGHPLFLTPLSESQFWQMKQERIPDADIAFCSGLRHEQIDRFISNVHDIVNQPILLQEDRLQPGVAQSLAQLKQHGACLSVVTLRFQAQAVQLLQQFHVSHYFDRISGAPDWFSAYQNYTEGKQAILADLIRQIQPTRDHPCWIIGDTEADVLAGQALGLSTVALTCGIRSYDYLKRLHPTTVQRNLQTATQYLLTHAVPA
ncbi:MAG: HAD hydrolase-like protein [Thermosynechococcaceae cyanobacterium]